MTAVTRIALVAAACCGFGMAAESANDYAVRIVNSHHVKAVSMVQDMANGNTVMSAVSQLDVHTSMLALSLSKVFLALHKLEQRGWFTAERKTSDLGCRAKFYSSTRLGLGLGQGRRQLETEAANWERLSAAISHVIRFEET